MGRALSRLGDPLMANVEGSLVTEVELQAGQAIIFFLFWRS